ncbi:MAG TPA: serine hydrolase [Bacilli bacterium]|nr:serine hydrolase [Bacilli bacterium]
MNKLSRLETILTNNQLVGGGYLVLHKENDQFTIASHYERGLANRETGQALSLETIFRIASVSKMVVALAMMSFVEKKKVTIDSDIGDILGYRVRNPHFPHHPITIKMLMTQTSSLTDGYSDETPTLRGYNGVNGQHFAVKLADLLVPNTGPYYTDCTWDQREPGSTFIYSKFGCGILACLIEKLSNEPFVHYVKKTILDPLQIDASFQATTISRPDLIASLYYAKPQTGFVLARSQADFIKAVYPLFTLGDNFRGPAGGMFISLRGLARIAELFLNRGVVQGKRLFQTETIDLMLAKHWQGANDEYYAKGLQIRFLPFERLLKGHTGSAYGLSSLLFFNEETQTALCFASNGGYFYPAALGLNQVQEQLIRAYYEEFVQKKL